MVSMVNAQADALALIRRWTASTIGHRQCRDQHRPPSPFQGLYKITAMKTEHHYRWLTKWNGKMTPSRYHCTEEAIRKNHPEAVRIEGTLIVREIPETDDEWRARNLAVDSAYIGLNAGKRDPTA